MIKTVPPAQLKQWLDRNEAILIDVREPAEYRAAHIAHSASIPLGDLSWSALPNMRDKKVVVHCKAGVRGQNACQKLEKEIAGREIYNLEGGIEAWENAGLPVEKSERAFLPIDRQAQTAIGSFVLIGTALGAFMQPAFLIVPAFFGVGLLFAGLTGFCGLARLLAYAPWNR